MQRTRNTVRSIVQATIILASFCLLPAVAHGGVSIYPTVVYSGANPLTITSSDGISKVEMLAGGSWKSIRIGYSTANYNVLTSPAFANCAEKATFSVFVNRLDRQFSIQLRVTECDGSRDVVNVGLASVWNVFHEDFGTVTIGEEPCETFSVLTRDQSFYVEKVVSPSKMFSISYPFKKPPLNLKSGATYRYNVCFSGTKTGTFRIPILVHIRRDQPVGKHTTFVVADTAIITVVAARRDPGPVQPVRPVRPRPRPVPVPEPPPPPPPPPPVLATEILDVEPPLLASAPELAPIDTSTFPTASIPEYVVDPTTFRTILTPTARTLRKGETFASSYDVAGIVAGTGVSDRLTLIGGGLYVPSFIEETYAVTLGGKYGFVQDEMFRVAGGIQGSYSKTPESGILLIAPYVVADHGNVNASASIKLGYAARRHHPVDGDPFTKSAVFVGVGGDLRFADRWKVASELFVLQDSEFQPFALTLRYFGSRFAIDGGAAFDLTPSGGIVLVPVVSGVWVW